MKIAIVGTGYVGLSTGVCLSNIGHQVICIDNDEQKINKLQKGVSPIYEPGLEDLLVKNASEGRLTFTTSHQEGLKDADIIMIAVGTPQSQNGAVDLSFLEQAASDIAAHLDHNSIVVIKSTVPVGTNEYIKSFLEKECSNRITINIVSNPEFLRQGSAIKDTLYADRIVIGTDNSEAAELIQHMYRPLNVPYLVTSVRSAEMIKYASNAFLATKISFINEIANLCEAVGADVEEVAMGMGRDKRIGETFLRAGIGYGGSCFPKDVKALLNMAHSYGLHFSMLKETMSINENQKRLLVKKALNRFEKLEDKKIAMLGLSFKPETDDMREAPSIDIAHLLADLGADVIAHDPIAISNAEKIIGDRIMYSHSIHEAIMNADAVFIVTEWEEYKKLDLASITKIMKQPIIFDGRSCMDVDEIYKCENIEYYAIGRPEIIVRKDESH